MCQRMNGYDEQRCAAVNFGDDGRLLWNRELAQMIVRAGRRQLFETV